MCHLWIVAVAVFLTSCHRIGKVRDGFIHELERLALVREIHPGTIAQAAIAPED